MMRRSSTLHLLPVIVIILSLFIGTYSQSPARDLKPTIILVSLDGFRWDYPQKYDPPTINGLIKNGVRAKWMIPSFPTKTFPNHYTVVTGLYPANHGIVENNVFDFGTVFTMSKREEVENPRWWGGEPIWVTAESQGQIAASYFWVGSEAKVKGRQPTYWKRYDRAIPNEVRVDTVLSWFDLPREKRPTMITLYFSDTDNAGHAAGPDSEEVRNAVKKVDGDIARLVDGLRKRKIDGKVNIIITSDHGMAAYYPRNATFLDDHFDFDLAENILWANQIVQIFPKPGKLDEIFDKIKALEHTTCWKKGELPARLKYNDGKRVAPIVCSTEPGWIATSRAWHDNWLRGLDDPDRPRGGHGHDNKYQEMQATFIAHGPAFKKGFVAEPFENIHVYELMCKILGLKPAPNDGSLKKVKSMLK